MIERNPALSKVLRIFTRGEELSLVQIMLLYFTNNAVEFESIMFMPAAQYRPKEETVAEEAAAGATLKQTPWPLVRKRTIPTEGPPFVDEI
jgi:hypothetical protein